MTEEQIRDHLNGFEARLLPMLLEAVEERAGQLHDRPRPSRRKVRQYAVTALAAVVALVIATTIAVGDDTVHVRAADAVADPQAVARELRAIGIEAEILVVPVPRVVAGTWWHLYFAPGVDVDHLEWAKLKAQVGQGVLGFPEETSDRGAGIYHAEVLELPADLPGPVTLVAGRAAQEGEPIATTFDELAPVGAFYCLHLERMAPEEAGRELAALGYRVIWVYETHAESHPVAEPPKGSAITSAGFRTPEVVDVRLASTEQAAEIRNIMGTPNSNSIIPAWAPSCIGAGS